MIALTDSEAYHAWSELSARLANGDTSARMTRDSWSGGYSVTLSDETYRVTQVTSGDAKGKVGGCRMK